MNAICVFCGSSVGRDPVFARAAAKLGRLLAEQQISLVYGGGRAGLMGVISEATMATGGQVHGVITRAFRDQDDTPGRLTKLTIVESMHDRKATMAEASDGFIMLPGGLGTLEEFLEAATWTQLGIQNKPCGILNIDGYFDPLITLLDQSAELQFFSSGHRDQIVVDSEPESLVARLICWERN